MLLLLDGTPAHLAKCMPVSNTVVRILLPTYCPQLSPTERL
jgi:hypothetical protein